MEGWVLCNFQHVCWSQGGIGLTKLDSGRLPLVTRFSWEFKHKKQRENGFGLLWIRTLDPCVHLPLKALKKGLQTASGRKQKLKIKFYLEGVVKDGQKLYVSGSAIPLGTWDPELAIPMSSFEGKTNLWQAEIQVAPGTVLEYNYFVQRSEISSNDIKWRPGPSLCLKVPSAGQTSKNTIEVQDRWCDTSCGNTPVLSSGASWEDTGVPDKPNGSLVLQSSNIEDISTEYTEVNTQHVSGQLISAISGTISGNICNVPEEPLSPVINTQVQIEHNGINSELLPKGVFKGMDPDKQCKNLDGKKIFHQPIEESWLPSGFILLKEESESQNLTPGTEISGVKTIRKDKGSKSQNLAVETGIVGCATIAEVKEGLGREVKLDNGAQSIKQHEREGGAGIVLNKDVVTEIIVNSSVCTIQRIAILEDGKPVEILLEPEGTNVQVGSIYLGVVKSVNCRMGSAWVDIGHTRLAFLNINEPFTLHSLDLDVKESSSDGNLTNKARVESDLKDEEEEFHELLEDVAQEDEIFMPHEYAKEKVMDGGQKGTDNMCELSKFEIDTNNLSNVNMEARDNFSENGYEMEGTVVKQYGSEELRVVKRKKIERRVEKKGIFYSVPSSVDLTRNPIKSNHVKEGTKIIVQVDKEGLGQKGPRVTTSPHLDSRFWALYPGGNMAAVSQKIGGLERKRLTNIAQKLKPSDCGLIVRTAAAGHSDEELQKDFTSLRETWTEIVTCAKSASLAAAEGVEGAVPVILHRAMGQTLSVVQNYFNEEVQRMVVDSPHTYHEVTSYLQEFAPSLVSRVELYSGKNLIFDEFGVETEIDNLLCKRVNISNGGYLVIEQTEALVSIDVNSGTSLLSKEMCEKQPILELNLAAARQIARELRLRDIGGIIVVDFIDMKDEKHKRMVYEEIKKAAQRDRSRPNFSELSDLGLMEISRKRVRPSLTYMFSEPCSYCNANARVEALDTIFSKIERAIRRLLVAETRFASHTIVLRRLVRVKEALCQMVISKKWGGWKQVDTEKAKIVKDLIFSDDFWNRVEYALELTEPLMSMLRYANTDEPCLGNIYDAMDSMLERMKSRREQDPDTLYSTVEKIVLHCWNKMTTPLHLLAYALSPRYYSSEILDIPGRVPPYRDPEVAAGYKRAHNRLFSDPDVASNVRREFVDFVSGKFAEPDAINDQSRLDAIGWWYLHGERYMYLQPLAIKILSQVASSSAAERNWSTYSFIHSVKRNRLGSKKTEDLVFIHNNWRLLSRKDPAYKKGPEKLWDVLPETCDLDMTVQDISRIALLDVEGDEEDVVASGASGTGLDSNDEENENDIDEDEPVDPSYFDDPFDP